jgi:type II secretory pathway component PulF
MEKAAMTYQKPYTIASSPFGLPWRASPFLPIESMAARQHSFLMIFATAWEQQLPIARLVSAFAMEHRRRFRWRLTRFAWLMQSDGCIASALEKTPELLPDETVTAIRLGTELGTLSETFAQLLETETPTSDEVQEKWNSIIGYTLVLIPTLGTIAMGFLFFVIPTYKKMFDEFELRLPAASQLYMSLAEVVANYIGPCFNICFVLLVVYLFTPLGLMCRRFFRRYLPGAFSSKSRRSAMQLLAVSLYGNASLSTATSLLARIHPAPLLRWRFQQANKKIEAGSEPWDSLATQRIVTYSQARSLSAMQDNDLRIWTLLRLAGGKRVVEQRRAYTFVSLIQPISILLIAVFVLWTCLMCFGPLVSLVTSLS